MLILNVATQQAKIAIQSEPAQLQQHTIPGELSIQREAATLEISRSPATLEIDQSACRYARGVKTLAEMGRDNAQAGYNTALEAIGRIAEEGDRLARIESKEDVVVDLAAEHSNSPETDIEWQYVPLPEIRYTPSNLQFNPSDGKLAMQYTAGHVQAEYQPGRVDISIGQYASVRYWVSENKIDISS